MSTPSRVRTYKRGFLGQGVRMLSPPGREEARSNHFWLSVAQFARLQPLLPTDTRGVPRVADRRVLSGIVQVWQSGWRWRAAPRVYGPAKTLYNRFVRWARKGVWAPVCTELAAARPGRGCWMRPTSKRIGRRRAEKGGAAAGDWAVPWGADHENPGRGR